MAFAKFCIRRFTTIMRHRLCSLRGVLGLRTPRLRVRDPVAYLETIEEVVTKDEPAAPHAQQPQHVPSQPLLQSAKLSRWSAFMLGRQPQ